MSSSELGSSGHRRGSVAALILASGLVLIQLLYLKSIILPDVDEGVYVYAGRLIAEGSVPYRDFMLAHPPALPVFVAVIWHFVPGPVAARVAYLLIVSALGLSTFALVRKIRSSTAAGLAAMALQTLGMLFIGNMGRAVRLEPLMAVLLMAGAWAALRSANPRWRIFAGVFLALALLVKFTAVAVGVPLVLALLWFDEPDWRSRFRSLGWMSLGAALVLVPTLGWMFSEPGFVRWAIHGQLARERDSIGLRMGELALVCRRFPLFVIGIWAALRILFRGKTVAHGERALAAGGLIGTLVLVFGFKTFYSYYVIPSLLLLTACLAMELDRLADARRFMLSRVWTVSAICSVALVLCFAYVEAYHLRGKDHEERPAQIVNLLKGVSGPVYTMVPDFVLWNNQRMPDGYYIVDSYLPRIIGVIGDADLQRMLSRVDAAVTYRDEFNATGGDYPAAPGTNALLVRDFKRAYSDSSWELWLRAPGTQRQP